MAEYVERGPISEIAIHALESYKEAELQNIFEYSGQILKDSAELEKAVADRINDVRSIPAADVVEVVRCKNCKHRPVVVNPSRPYGFGLAGPGSDPFGRDETCPYLCDDGYYNRMPDDDGFCNLGEVKDG
jgi:hypothetical protein